MEQEKKLENYNKNFWQFIIVLISIILIVLAGGIIVILLQGGHHISGEEVVRDASFSLVIFIPIWVALIRKKIRPAPKEGRIIKIMLITGLILLILNVLVFWLF